MKKTIKLFEITHDSKGSPVLVLAESVEDAITKFNKYYDGDYYVTAGNITACVLKHTFEVID